MLSKIWDCSAFRYFLGQQQRQPLRSNRPLQISKASNVAARMGQTLNEALVDGFGDKDASPKLRRTS
jgi:hypothetical protein